VRLAASADRGLRPERVAEVIVALPGGAVGRRGSGYLLASGKVLTAAHVVERAAGVRVRFQADRPGERIVEAAVEWAHEAIDVAVLTLPGGDRDDAPVVPVSFGRVGETDAVLRCTALGFPRFKLRTGQDGARFRDAEHIDATCAILSNRREGTLDLAITAPPAEDPDPVHDAWEGMSGAAVFSDGRLIGVVSRHHRRDGPGRIAASRVDRWADALSAQELGVLQRVVGCVLRPSVLPTAVPATGLDLVREAYRAQLADITPERLEDRESEVRDLVSFCSGTERYRWVQGPPWAGKTALAAWFAGHPPRGVVPVWFFLTAGQASQSYSDAYTAALIDQLAAVAGREPAGTGSPTARDGERRLLLRQAAERVAQDGKTLLLVVDGLDEDQSLMPGGSGTSIASLLPERLPSNVRVLITSRTNPGLPPDVRGEHPLRHCRVTSLSATEAARHTEHEAKFDLRRALTGDRLQRDLVGLLTAARGTLALDDLRELTGETAYELRNRLGSAFGRVLRLRGGDYGGTMPYAPGRGYLFAHETLLTAAQNELGPDVDAYRERLHVWADSYARRGWPEDTPAYLLQPYGRLLASFRDACRATALATDARRRDRLYEVAGSDALCLAEIASARETVRLATPDDLGALAALAVAEDLVARRNVRLHPDIPAVHARLGRTWQAIGLARSVFRNLDRAMALAGVAGVLAKKRDRRAVGLAEEAVKLAEKAQAEAVFPSSGEHLLRTQGTLATTLVWFDRGDEAVRLLCGLPRPRDASAAEALIEAAIGTAAVLLDRLGAIDLLCLAESAIWDVRFAPDRVRVQVAVAEAWAAAGFLEEAARLRDSVVRHVLRDPFGGLASVAARALRATCPHMAGLVAESDTAKLFADRDLDAEAADGMTLDEDVYALVAEERMADAERLVDRMRDEAFGSRHGKDRHDTWLHIAEGWARAGEAAEAWQALERSRQHLSLFSDNHGTTARMIRLLAEAGAAEQVEALLLAEKGPPRWHIAEALASLAAHFAADAPERSQRLLHRAESGHRMPAGAIPPGRHEHLAALAGALATVGRCDEAERLVTAVGDPEKRAWGWAVVALAVGHTGGDTGQVLGLAERAVEESFAIEEDECDEYLSPRALKIAVQLLGHVGAAERVEEIFARIEDKDGPLSPYERRRAREEVAAGLWSHDPDLARRLLEEALLDEYGDLAYDVPYDECGFLISRAVHRLVIVEPHGDEHTAPIWRYVEREEAEPYREWRPDDAILLTLLSAPADPVAARDRLDELAAEADDEEGAWFSPVRNAVALAHAALGDDKTARAVARRLELGMRRSETFAHLAAYAAGVPADTVPISFREDPWDTVPITRRLAALMYPPASGRDLPRARSFLAEALTPDGWQHAVPVLAVIDPDAVLRMRDVVFAYLGLGDEQT
jgi:hypothetical protein